MKYLVKFAVVAAMASAYAFGSHPIHTDSGRLRVTTNTICYADNGNSCNCPHGNCWANATSCGCNGQ
jgi:hypothetical protein